MSIERDQAIGRIAEAMMVAARTSVARGAQYAQGETVSTDARAAWIEAARVMFEEVEKNIFLDRRTDIVP